MRGSRGHPQRLSRATGRSCRAYQRRADRSMTDIVVESLGVARSFERGNRMIEALAPATCRVRAGDRVALMGPSGSGKSTLVHLMAFFGAALSGGVLWAGVCGPGVV